MTRRIAKDPLVAFVRDIFAKAGCSESEAQRIGTYLVSANLTGHDSHGVQRVPRYLQWLADGDFKADVTVKIESETPVLAVVDGGFGFGQTVAPQAVDLGIKKAKAMGLSAIAAASEIGPSGPSPRASSRSISSTSRAVRWLPPMARSAASFQRRLTVSACPGRAPSRSC
jgi:LDH2 family malate/lactate/ureidoglycolate dehydrogenase